MIRIGNIELELLCDGWDVYTPRTVFAAPSADDLTTALAGQLDERGLIHLPLHAVLVRSGGRTALLDAGFGRFAETPEMGGGLTRRLAQHAPPSGIDVVAISHCHADHIGGLVRGEDDGLVPMFEGTRHVMLDREWAFWTSEANLVALHPELAEPARVTLPVIAPLVETAEAETELIDGVRLAPAAGHTPGHAVVFIESKGERAIFAGDAIFHRLSAVQPRWPCAYDIDPVAAVESRRQLLERAAHEQSLIIAGHLPSPFRVVKSADGYVPIDVPVN